jgi:hypothetical protein
MLQAANVMRDDNGRISHVYLCPIIKDGIIIRDLKTLKSTASLPIESDSIRQAFERRLTAVGKGLFLFPRIPDECGIGNRWTARKTKDGETEKSRAEDIIRRKFIDDNQAWPAELWDKKYIKRLRTAGKKVKGIDVKRLDSRTLRRTRGRDVILATKSIHETATLLRDGEATVMKHYARLLPMDVKVK